MELRQKKNFFARYSPFVDTISAIEGEHGEERRGGKANYINDS